MKIGELQINFSHKDTENTKGFSLKIFLFVVSSVPRLMRQMKRSGGGFV